MKYFNMLQKLFLLMLSISIFVLLPSVSYAISADGFYGLKFQSALHNNRTSYLLRHYGSLEVKDIVNGLSFNTYVQAQHDLGYSADDYNIYYLYLRYTTFEKAVDITLGRFEQIGNSFMTLDGFKATYKSDYYIGATVYAGVPFFKNFEDKQRIFRNTGDFAYGAKIFMNGIRSSEAYISYYHEMNGITTLNPKTYTQQIAVGGGYVFDLSQYADNSSSSLKADISYDISTMNLYSASINSRTIYDIYTITIFGDLYNVQNLYPSDREFILQMLSNGKEMRIGATVAVNVLKYLDIYGGAKLTNVQLLNNQTSLGGMYNIGVIVDMLKLSGILIDSEVYYYNTYINKAFGANASVEWRFLHDFALFVGAEYANINRTKTMTNAFLVEGELKINITYDLMLKIFVRGGNNNIYIDNLVYGAMVRYDF